MTNNRSTRKTPPDDEDDWSYIWSGVDKAHQVWPVGKVLLGLFGNWKVIGLGLVAFLVMGGQEVLTAWGIWK